jgi:signal transduction histidine kinase
MERLNLIIDRISQKKADYKKYNLTQEESNAFKTFFDLSQEFDSMKDFTLLCVAIPKSFFNLDARLYLIDPKKDAILLSARTDGPGYQLHTPTPKDIKPSDTPYYSDKGSLILTIRGKEYLSNQLPFTTIDNVLGILAVYPLKKKHPHLELFFEKFANRIGFNLHNRLLVKKNIEHLKFIQSLVADIEHNVIVPNVIYKLFLRHLREKITDNIEFEKQLSEYASGEYKDDAPLAGLIKKLVEVNRGLMGELENIEKHHKNMSLFIETLFRRSHFDQGRLTLRTKLCNMKKDVVLPQLDRFLERFKNMGIALDDRLSGIPEEDIINVVDIGLIAQVYANFFSNAVKYTEEVITDSGNKAKYVAYGSEHIKDFFGDGKDGVKYNVYSTGRHIGPEERERLFEDGYRGSNSPDKSGTGHGLSFIKNIIELHGGTVGYEETQFGNNFYFIIPK